MNTCCEYSDIINVMTLMTDWMKNVFETAVDVIRARSNIERRRCEEYKWSERVSSESEDRRLGEERNREEIIIIENYV